MGMFDFEDVCKNDPTSDALQRAYQHWVDIINERRSVEEFMASVGPSKAVPTKAIESMFGSEYDTEFTPKKRIELKSLSTCALGGRSPTALVNRFRPMLKHVDLKHGHMVTGWYDRVTLEPVAIISLKNEEDDKLWIKALEVNEKYRGAGIGKQVVQWVTGCYDQPLYLAVHPDNKVALFLYDSFGFVLDPASQKEFTSGNRANVIMIRR